MLFEFGPVDRRSRRDARGEVMFKSRIATLIYVNIGQPAMAAELTDLRAACRRARSCRSSRR